MVVMSDEVLKIFENPDCFVKPIDKDKLLIGVSFISKTALNVKNGSHVAVGNAVYPNGFMIKGCGEIMNSGKYFEDFKERINKRFGGKIKPKLNVH